MHHDGLGAAPDRGSHCKGEMLMTQRKELYIAVVETEHMKRGAAVGLGSLQRQEQVSYHSG